MKPMSTGVKTFKVYFSQWRKHPWLVAGSFLMGPAFALQATIAPLFIAKILGQLADGIPVSNSYIWWAVMSLFGGIVLWFIADTFFSVKLILKVGYELHEANFQKILNQEYNFFSDTFGGSLVAQANRLVRAYELFHVTFFLDVIGQICSVLVALAIMIYFNTAIGLIVGIGWLISVGIVIYLGVKRMPTRRQAVALETLQTGQLADSVTNAITIKTFATEQSEAERFAISNSNREHGYRLSWRLAIRNNVTIQILCAALQIIVLLGGINAVKNGSISLAIFLLFEVYILRIIDSIGKSSLFVRQFEGLLGDAHDMTEILEREPHIKDSLNPEIPQIKKGEISFDTVHFNYPDQQASEPLFKNFNLNIKAGERVGLVGPSGGGKTTITRLLLRFHDIDDGIISIDGQNIVRITQAELHKYVAYVPQEPLLFHRSLAENIGYASNATLDKIVAISKKAHAHDFIKALPNGYDTLVGERGVKLSGGQRQRVAIARAMLRDAPMLVLDEATSALDSESEKLVQDALWKLMENKTALVIAHRLSTIQRMDRIVVLDDGKIIEQGSHKQLLGNNGLYARLWAHQSGGFLEE